MRIGILGIFVALVIIGVSCGLIYTGIVNGIIRGDLSRDPWFIQPVVGCMARLRGVFYVLLGIGGIATGAFLLWSFA